MENKFIAFKCFEKWRIVDIFFFQWNSWQKLNCLLLPVYMDFWTIILKHNKDEFGKNSVDKYYVINFFSTFILSIIKFWLFFNIF